MKISQLATALRLESRATNRSKLLTLRNMYALMAITVISSPAFAQFDAATNVLNKVKAWLLVVGVIIVTLALMFVGFRMMFGAATFKDVAPVFWGGILVGGGAAIAGMFFT